MTDGDSRGSSAGNPFAVLSPEGLVASDVVELFVSNVPGVDVIQGQGHTLLVGTRGSGKTMIMRFLEPDCQRLLGTEGAQVPLSDIDYYAAYVTIKQTDLTYPQLMLSEGSHENLVINEHFLCLSIILKIVARALANSNLPSLGDHLRDDQRSELDRLLSRIAGAMPSRSDTKDMTDGSEIVDIFDHIKDVFEDIFDLSSDYLFSLARDRDLGAYRGPLLRFSNSLLPLIEWWRRLPGMPVSGRFFLLIDDADRLTDTQTLILNSWISRRVPELSIKVGAELYEYKTYNTLGSSRIETPHDYTEINLTDVYAFSRTEFYRSRLKSMVERRLNARRGDMGEASRLTAARYFPEESGQEAAVAKLFQSYLQGDASSGGGRTRDAAYRYARPDYMANLGGRKKKRSTYSYSGFNQLVNISSGVPRHFLECAYKMYDRIGGGSKSGLGALSIPPNVQDAVVREAAETIFTKEIESLRYERSTPNSNPRHALYLHNLIKCLGALFASILLDKSLTERRVFSIAISDDLDKDTAMVFRMGVKNGYFVRSTIGRKEGVGRTELFVLTRRLAPYFGLDPNGFSAYKFVQNQHLRRMMIAPDEYLRELRASRSRGDKQFQSDLFSYLEADDDQRD